VLSIVSRLSLLRFLIGAIFVVLIVVAPVITIIGILLGLYPFLRFGAIYIGLEGHGLASGEGRRAAVTTTGQSA
jgi:hypothetical protein